MMKPAFLLALLTLTGIPARAHAQQPAAPIQLTLSPQDQANLRSICVLAVRSPQVTDEDAVLLIGEFCAQMRQAMARANAAAKAPPQAKE